jgi:hypothetical protein
LNYDREESRRGAESRERDLRLIWPWKAHRNTRPPKLRNSTLSRYPIKRIYSPVTRGQRLVTAEVTAEVTAVGTALGGWWWRRRRRRRRRRRGSRRHRSHRPRTSRGSPSGVGVVGVSSQVFISVLAPLPPATGLTRGPVRARRRIDFPAGTASTFFHLCSVCVSVGWAAAGQPGDAGRVREAVGGGVERVESGPDPGNSGVGPARSIDQTPAVIATPRFIELATAMAVTRAR